jgi:hypothetical protein
MKRFLNWAVIGLVAGFGMIGCDLLGPVDDDSVTIKINTPLTTITGGSFDFVDATVSGNVEITSITVTVETEDGASVSTDLIKVDKRTMPTGEEKITIKEDGDMEVRINVYADACEGDYVLTIKANAGSVSSTKTDTFTVTDAKDCSVPDGTPVTEVTINAGANSNADYGSSIDIDAGKAMMKSEAASNVSDIDLCYAYSGTNNVEKIGTAMWAEASGYTFADGWSNPPDIKFYKESMTSAEFDAVDTKEEIEALWDETKATASSYEADQGDVFLVETTEGTLAILRITSQEDGAAGSITIKVAK